MDKVTLAKQAWLGSITEVQAVKRTGNEATVGNYGDYSPLYDLLADDVVWKVTCPEDTMRYGPELRGKHAVIDLFMSEPEVIEEVDWERPLEFIGRGDRVVAVGTETYKFRKTGVRLRDRKVAIVMTFRDDLIARILIITNLAEWNDACPRPMSRAATS